MLVGMNGALDSNGSLVRVFRIGCDYDGDSFWTHNHGMYARQLYTTIWVSSRLHVFLVSMKHPYPFVLGALWNCIPKHVPKDTGYHVVAFFGSWLGVSLFLVGVSLFLVSVCPGWGRFVKVPATCQTCSKCRPPRERSAISFRKPGAVATKTSSKSKPYLRNLK